MSVSETNSDTSTPTVTTTANDWKNRATMPSRNSTEPKIDTSVRLAATTAKPTCSVPSIAAVWRSSDGSSSSRRYTFSSTTIASSTTTPISSSRPSSDIWLKV